MGANNTQNQNALCAGHKGSSELKAEIFKFFGNSRHSKTSTSIKKKRVNSPIIILSQMRKTRLKSDIFVEHIENVLPDGEYDISKEDFVSNHINTKKTPPKKKDDIVESKPALRRSTRLKSEVLDRSSLSILSNSENVTNVPATNLGLGKLNTDVSMNTSDDCKTTMEHNLKTRNKGKKHAHESDESFLDTINADIIADMLLLTDVSIGNELENPNISKRRRTTTGQSEILLDNSPKKRRKTTTEQSESLLDNSPNKSGKYNRETRRNNHIIQAENANIHLENDTQTSVVKTNKEVKPKKKTLLRKTRSSIKTDVTNGKGLEANETNTKNMANSNKALNISTPKPSNNNGILKYFKAQNKQLDKVVKCQDSPKKHESVVKPSEITPDGGAPNTVNLKISNQINSVQTPAKRGRGRPPLSLQRISKINISKQPGVKKYTKISKMTKEQIKNVRTRKIPKDRLDDVLNMIDNEDHAIWDDRNTSCNPYIFHHWNQRSLNSDHNIKIKYARQFLLRKDWISLSKTLCLFNKLGKGYYPLLAKYAALLLAHTDKEQFNKFIQFLTKFNDSGAVMKTCTQISLENYE